MFSTEWNAAQRMARGIQGTEWLRDELTERAASWHPEMSDAQREEWVARQAYIATGVQAYRCACCGDDVMDVPPICDECTLAGCEQTRDASGELNYWDCQTDR